MSYRGLALQWLLSSLVALACGGRSVDVIVDGDDELASSTSLPRGSARAEGTLPAEPASPDAGATPNAPAWPLPAQSQTSAQALPVPADCDLSVPETRAQYAPPPACALPETVLGGMAHDAAELQDLLPGIWLACSYPTLFNSEDEIGLEVTSDGSWYKLYSDGLGGFRRGNATGQHGAVEGLDNGGYMQVNYELGGSTYINVPEFARTPLKMRINAGLGPSTYLKNDSRGRCVQGAGRRSRGGPYTLPAACSDLTEPRAPNRATSRSLLRGRWLSCQGSLFGTEDDVGIELGPDGHFYKLYIDAAGELYRGQGFDEEGSYELLDQADFVQLSVTVAGSGQHFIQTRFGSPGTAAFDNFGVWGGKFVFVEE
jgi:hypothetical protein